MEEKQDIGALFDRIAGTYDRFNHLLSLNIDRTWRRKAVSLLKPSENVLDVAIGTGELSFEMLRQKKAASITGIDLSEKMMETGRERAAAKGIVGIKFILASALDIPFPDASFDAVTCAYGVRNFSDLDKGLQEMYRVLKPGGQLVILEFSYPTNRFIRPLYDFFFCNVMPVVGRLVSRDASAYKYFRSSVKGFIWGREMADRISGAGFANVSCKTLSFGISTIYTAYRQ